MREPPVRSRLHATRPGVFATEPSWDTSKVVLMLGRFTPERKAVLDALREELRKHDYLPVLFDFDKQASKDITVTVSTLANMARSIIPT